MAGATEDGRRGAAALLLVQLAVGYEWLVSGLTKLARGDFPAGLRDELGEMAKGAPGWYADFLGSVVEPHAAAFGYAIESAELLAGLVLVGGATLLLARGGRVPALVRLATLAALAAGLLLAVAFELANGGGFGLRLAGDSFDEGVDLDTVLVGLQLALLVPLVRTWRRAAAPALRAAESGR